jgi:hypothetical protein
MDKFHESDSLTNFFLSVQFKTKKCVSSVVIAGRELKSSFELYECDYDIVLKEYNESNLDYGLDEEVMGGMKFFRPTHRIQEDRIIVFYKGEEIIHPWLVLAQRDFSEGFILDKEYIDKFLIRDIALDYQREGYVEGSSWVLLRTKNIRDEVFVKDKNYVKIETEMIPVVEGSFSPDDDQWFLWYEEVGYFENLGTMERLLLTYEESLKNKVILFPGDGFGVGYRTLKKLEWKNMSYSTDISRRMRIGARYRLNEVTKKCDEYYDCEILLHVACAGYIPKKDFISVDFMCSLGRTRDNISVQGFKLKTFSIGGNVPRVKIKDNPNLDTVDSLRRCVELDGKKPIYLMRERSLVMAVDFVEDLPSVICVEYDRFHFIKTRVRQFSMIPFKEFFYNGTMWWIYKVKLKLNEKSYFVNGDNNIMILGAHSNSIEKYGSVFVERSCYNGKTLSDLILNGCGKKKLILRGPFFHPCSKKCECATFIFEKGKDVRVT